MYNISTQGIEFYWSTSTLTHQIIEKVITFIKTLNDDTILKLALTTDDTESIEGYLQSAISDLFLIFIKRSYPINSSLYVNREDDDESDKKSGFSIKVVRDDAGNMIFNPSKIDILDNMSQNYIIFHSIQQWATNNSLTAIEKACTEEVFKSSNELKNTLFGMRPIMHISTFSITD